MMLLDAALGYAARGWFVFPCAWIEGVACSCKDPECISPGKHPLTPHGLLEATNDPALVRDFWTKFPKANIAVVTGAKSGIAVVDVDDVALAKSELERLCPGYSFRSVPLQKTGKGWHLAFAYPGIHVKTVVKFLPGMDSRGDGGYIMAAPSNHLSGKPYEWKNLPSKEKFPPLPSELLTAINGPLISGNGTKPRFDTAGALKGVPEGKRRETVFKLACKLRHADVPFDMAEKLILEAWRNCDPGSHAFTEREALAQVTDVYQRYPSGEDSKEDKVTGTGGGASKAKQKTDREAEEKPVDWSNPEKLPDELPSVPAMAPAMIPESLRPWLCDIADRMQCPLDFPVIGAIVTAGSLIGRQLAIRPKRQDDWIVIPNLWGGVVGRPGIMKTPALDEAKKPLQRLEIEALKDHEDQKQAHEIKLMVLKAKKEEIQKRIKEAIANEASIEGFEIPKEEELILRRYMVNDSTVEKLGELLNQNPHGLLLFRDELTGWLRTLDREGHENDRAFYLESWNGSGSYTYDRIGRGTLNIEAACVSILGGIQPGPLNDYLESTLKGGAGADGLFQRFQLLVYPDDPGPWKNIDRWPDTKAKNDAFRVFKDIAGEGFVGFVSSSGVASPDENESGNIPFLRFSPQGQEVFDDWRRELENKIRSGDDHPAVEAHLSKYRSLMPSLALIFHVVSTIAGRQGTPVSEAAASMAAAWCDYLEAHARRVYHGLIQRDISTAHRLAKKITGKDLSDPFTTRDVYRKHWTGLSDDAVIEAGAAILDELGWIKTVRVGAGPNGGRPTLKYWINPNVVGKAA
jgi:hypothetical protein